MLSFIIFNIFYCCIKYNFAQEPITDSLHCCLEKAGRVTKLEFLHDLTRQQWNTDPDKAMKYARMAYEISIKAHDSLNLAMAYKNMGIIYYLTGENEKALEYYNKALNVYTLLSDMRGISSCINNIGIIFKCFGEYDKALVLYKKSLLIDYKLDDNKALASTLNNIGEIYHLQGFYDKAIFFYKQSLFLEMKFNNYDGIGESFLNIGSIYQENGMYKESMENYKKALMLFIKTGNANRIALVCHDIGELFYSEKVFFYSYLYAKKSMNLRQKLGDKQGIASTSILLALIYEALGYNDLADEYLFKGLLMELELKNKKKISIALTNKGKMLYKSDEYDQAIKYFLNSLELALEMNAWPEILDNYEYLSESYFYLHDTSKGLYYNDLYKILYDSIKKESSEIKRTNYETNNTLIAVGDHEKTSIIDKLGTKNIKPLIFLSTIIITFLIIFLFLLNQKNKRN